MTSKIEVSRKLLDDEGLEAIQEWAEQQEQSINVGQVQGDFDEHVESTAGYAVRLIKELRALLAAPEAPRQDAQQMASMPVERCYGVRAKMIIAFNESRKNGGDLDDGLDAAYKAALRYSPSMQSTVVGEAERLNGMLDAASELLRTKQRANRELRSELERIKTINDNNFNLLLDQIFAAPLSPDHSGGGAGVVLPRYTCIGKGGEYELLGSAIGAGTLKDMSAIPVYRDTTTGQLFVRTQLDFSTRMESLDKLKDLNQ